MNRKLLQLFWGRVEIVAREQRTDSGWNRGDTDKPKGMQVPGSMLMTASVKG